MPRQLSQALERKPWNVERRAFAQLGFARSRQPHDGRDGLSASEGRETEGCSPAALPDTAHARAPRNRMDGAMMKTEDMRTEWERIKRDTEAFLERAAIGERDRDRLALDRRCASYIEGLLWSAKNARREAYREDAPPPAWPAIRVYNMTTDDLWWLECGSQTLVRDWIALNPRSFVNSAAQQ